MRGRFFSWQSRQMCHTRSMELMPAIEEFMTPLPVWTERGEILLPLFGAGHLAWLAACLCAGVALVLMHRRLGEDSEKQRRFELAVALAPLLLLGIHSSSMLAWGAFNPNCLPLHICNLCEILALVYALSGERNVGDVLYGVGIVGSLAALLFPGWSNAPAWSLPSVCGFVEHALVLAFIAMKVLDGSIRPSRRDIWKPLAFTALYLAAIFPLNHLLGTNYAFVNWAPYGTPLLAWEEAFGNPGYIAIYALVFAALEAALFLPWRPEATPGQQR